jgi:hypothetical protein
LPAPPQKISSLPNRKILCGLTAFALMVLASPAVASEWRYGCRGVLPSGDAPIIIFNRSELIMLPTLERLAKSMA